MTAKVYVITVEHPQADPDTITFEDPDVEVIQTMESTYPFSKWCGDGEVENTISTAQHYLDCMRDPELPATIQQWYREHLEHCLEMNSSAVETIEIDWEAGKVLRYRERYGTTWFDAEGNEWRKRECKHCHRRVENDEGNWIDPEATGDDVTWRETCDANDVFDARHEVDEEVD